MLVDQLRSVEAQWTFGSDGRGSATAEAAHLLTLPVFDLSLDELTAISPLPNNCAGRLAYGLSSVQSLKQRLHVESVTEVSEEIPEWLIERWLKMLHAASDRLTVVLRECESASHTAAPTPSGEELYGNA
jgi:hypothetical protein